MGSSLNEQLLPTDVAKNLIDLLQEKREIVTLIKDSYEVLQANNLNKDEGDKKEGEV